MKYSFLGKVSLFFFLLSTSQMECNAEEFFSIGSVDSVVKQKLDPSASKNEFYIRLPSGVIVKYGDTLPNGYEWLADKSLKFPGGVILNKDGSLTLPNNSYPEEFDIQSDGSIIGPNNIVLQQKKEKKSGELSADSKEAEAGKGKKGEADSAAGAAGKGKKGETDIAAAEAGNGKKEEAGSKEKELSIEELLDFDRIFAEEKAAAEKGEKAGKKPIPVAENDKGKGKPAQPPKEKEKPAPPTQKKGEPIKIPANLRSPYDLAFLEGCWKDDTHAMGYCGAFGSPGKGYSRYCFDKTGRGQHTVIVINQQSFKGTAKAEMRGNALYIVTGEAYRPGKKSSFVPTTIDCTRTDNEAICKEISHCPSCPKVKHGIHLRRD